MIYNNGSKTSKKQFKNKLRKFPKPMMKTKKPSRRPKPLTNQKLHNSSNQSNLKKVNSKNLMIIMVNFSKGQSRSTMLMEWMCNDMICTYYNPFYSFQFSLVLKLCFLEVLSYSHKKLKREVIFFSYYI